MTYNDTLLDPILSETDGDEMDPAAEPVIPDDGDDDPLVDPAEKVPAPEIDEDEEEEELEDEVL